MQKIINRISLIGFWTLLAYMPFHIFLSQSLSLLTGGLDTWKITKDVLIALLTALVVVAVYWQRKANRAFNTVVLFAGLYGILHFVVWAINPDIYTKSAWIGTIYNNRLPCLLLIGIGVALLNPGKITMRRVWMWVLGISSFVALLGVIQYYLPTDFLTHFGYSLQRGARPSFAIDNEAGLTRIMSTFRDPNSLGAYLILPITALTYLLVAARNHYKRVMLSGLLLLDGLALFMTFSRSAWVATVISVLLVLWLQSYTKVMHFVKRYKLVLASGFVAVCAGLFFMRSTVVFQQYIIHTNPNRKTHLASNDYHKLLVEEGIKGIIKKPQGHGPGTAGLASIQNPNGGQLTENYYVQIGYELGVVGLIAFGAFSVWTYIGLYKCRRMLLATILCASFFGYLFMNMFLHTWSNEAVATQFFLLTGFILSSKIEVLQQK